MAGVRSHNGLHRDRPVERRQPSFVSNGQSKQVRIRDLLPASDMPHLKDGLIEDRQRVGPPMVVAGCAQRAKMCGDYLRQSRGAGIVRVAEYPNAPVDRNRAGCPSVPSVPAKPVVCVLVMRMPWIKESDKDVDVRKRYPHDSSRSSLISFRVGLRAPGRGDSSGTPFRILGAAFGSSDSRARSEMTRPMVILLCCASSRAICTRLSSRSSC